MFNIIYCELLKLKKSHFYLTILFINLVIPIFFLLILIKRLKGISEYIYQFEQMSFMFINIPILCLISAYIFSREFSLKTIQTLFCYPISRTKIFISKIITTIIVTTVIMFTQFIMFILIGLVYFHTLISSRILFLQARVYLYCIFTQLLIIMIAVFFAMIFKNTIIPLIFAVLISAANLFIISLCSISKISTVGNVLNENLNYIPSCYSLVILKNSYNIIHSKTLTMSSNSLLGVPSIIICIFVIVLELFICNLYYKNCNIK
ncbi:ABC transporter permease [Clostridium felsineum]|uniref:ABC transporter permease n=1 Tax=Clostridium felsineum TaxID=36839 RepID=UPI00098C8357|nr:ABC transporter permease [Clostridium felsineum]URZ04684.1 hypothetical protein CLAUR_047730 [Clostridium felsineum]